MRRASEKLPVPGMAQEQQSGHGCLACLDIDNMTQLQIFLYFQNGAEGKPKNPNALIPQGLPFLRDMEEAERERANLGRAHNQDQKDKDPIYLDCTPLGQRQSQRQQAQQGTTQGQTPPPSVSWYPVDSTHNLLQIHFWEDLCIC